MKVRTAVNQMEPYIPGHLKTGAVKLASNENPFGPSPRALETIQREASSVHLYPDQNSTRLRQAIAEKYQVSVDHVMIGNGSDELMVMIAGTYLEPGDCAVTADVTFSQYAFSTLLFGGAVRRIPLASGRYDLSSMLQVVDEATRLVFICNPNNPTGTYVTHAELHEFLSALPEHVLVVVDEAYAEFATAADFPELNELVATFPNVVLLRTFSKAYGLAGLRIGYGISRPEIIRDVLRTKQPFNVNILAQSAGVAAIGDDAFLRTSLDNNRDGREYLYGELKKIGLAFYPTEANYICINTEHDALDLFQRIMDRGVTIRPLRSFGLPKSIRVTIGTPSQNQLFIRCLRDALSDLAQNPGPANERRKPQPNGNLVRPETERTGR